MKKVGIVMGSDSDLPIIKKATAVLDDLKIPYTVNIYSAHRTPEQARDFSLNARARVVFPAAQRPSMATNTRPFKASKRLTFSSICATASTVVIIVAPRRSRIFMSKRHHVGFAQQQHNRWDQHELQQNAGQRRCKGFCPKHAECEQFPLQSP